jgi:hypothetical protein
VEALLIAQIRSVDEGYAAAKWKQGIIESGIVTPRQYKAWLAAQTPDAQVKAETMRTRAAAFLNELPASDADVIRAARVCEILRTDGTVLWALDALIGDSPLPDHPDLVQHVEWVATYLS